MDNPAKFPLVSWGLCSNRMRMTPTGFAYCDVREAGPLYDGICWECRYLFAPADEARLWSNAGFWDRTIEQLPEPLARGAVLVLYQRMRRMALGEGEKQTPITKGHALDAARRLAEYGRRHYP